jgi:hypothetical protein
MEAVHGHLSRRGPTAIDADNPADREWGQRRAVRRATTTAVVVSTAHYAEHLGAALPISVPFEFGHLETAENVARQAVDVCAKPAPEVFEPAARTVSSA